MLTRDQAEKVAREMAGALRLYRGTEQHKHLMALIEALKVGYMHELLAVPYAGPRIALLQGAAQQIAALEQALQGELDGNTGRI